MADKHQSYGTESINPAWVLHVIDELQKELKELKERHCKLQADFVEEQKKTAKFAQDSFDIFDAIGSGKFLAQLAKAKK